MRLFVCAFGAALVVAGAATAATPRPLVVEVDHVRAYLDASGAGKGELLIRVFSVYGRQGAKGKWWGVTEASVRGPGGVVNVASIRRLHHPERGERVDHRLLLRPEVARHVLGRAGAHAHLKVTASAYLIPIRAPGSAKRLLCCADRATKISAVTSFPGEQRTFGNGTVTVDWSETSPWQAYVSTMIEHRTGDEISGANATIQSDGSFSGTGEDTCGDAASINGSVTPPSNGTFPDNAALTIQWNIPPNDLGGCGSYGQQTYAIDPG